MKPSPEYITCLKSRAVLSPPYTTRRANRQGVIYITVLAIGTLVMVMALGALLASRSLARASLLTDQSDEAANYAFSAVELGRLMITNDQYWRTDYSPGTWFTKNIGSGTMALSVNTADSTFSNYTENITLLGTGTKGNATQKLQATLLSVNTPLGCMSYAITSNGSASLGSATINTASAGLFSNGSVTASGTVGIPVSAVGNITGSYYQRQVLTGCTAVTLPTSSTLFSLSAYSSNAGTINYSSISNPNDIKNTLISPAVNPYGSANASGVYVINCGGKNLTIHDCRIVGTLVVLNAGSVTLSGSINWAPATSNYPCLLIQGGTLTINFSNNALSEGGVNYNPASTPYPYPSGASNSNTSDSYPSAITGLMYASGGITINGNPSIGILVTGGTLTISGGGTTISPNYNSIYNSSPPPGFYTNTLVTNSNTFARSVN